MVVNKGEKIILNLMLIRNDGITVEENATVTFKIFDSSGQTEVVSEKNAVFNSNLKSYIYELTPSLEWATQDVGVFLIVWGVSDTYDDFNSIYTENIQVNIDNIDIKTILGLCHKNMTITDCEYDAWQNLKRAKIILWKDSTKSEILSTYKINCDTINPGMFTTWEQLDE